MFAIKEESEYDVKEDRFCFIVLRGYSGHVGQCGAVVCDDGDDERGSGHLLRNISDEYQMEGGTRRTPCANIGVAREVHEGSHIS
jgi:hypothetical protein